MQASDFMPEVSQEVALIQAKEKLGTEAFDTLVNSLIESVRKFPNSRKAAILIISRNLDKGLEFSTGQAVATAMLITELAAEEPI